MALRRIKKELENMIKEPCEFCTAQPLEDENLFEWVGSVRGPKDSPYEGGVFFLAIVFPPVYPFKPPKVKFTTRVYHPNINKHGNISIDILDDMWSPAITIQKILRVLHFLLKEPCPDDPLDPEIAKVYKTNRLMYDKHAKDWTEKIRTFLRALQTSSGVESRSSRSPLSVLTEVSSSSHRDSLRQVSTSNGWNMVFQSGCCIITCCNTPYYDHAKFLFT